MPMQTGVGDPTPLLVICAPHRPPGIQLSPARAISPLTDGDLERFIQEGGNHWRKIYTLYAKLLHGLTPMEPDWQTCRDQRLLRSGSGCALLLEHSVVPGPEQLCLIMGQTFGRAEGWLPCDQTLPPEQPFFQHPEQTVIVTPYFDYRPLSNARMAALTQLIRNRHPHWLTALKEKTHQYSAK